MPRKIREVPWLDTEPNGYYYVYWYDKATKRTARQALGTKEAVEAQKRYAAFLSEGHEIYTESSGLTVAQALAFYWSEHVAKKVVDTGRCSRIIDILKQFFSNTLLKDVDIGMCERYADARRTGATGFERAIRYNPNKPKGVSDPTIRRELCVLVAAANHNRKRKRITAAEMPTFELPPATILDAIGENDWLTVDELMRAIEQARANAQTKPDDDLAARLFDFLVLAYDSASRRKAIEDMTVSQVDLRTGIVNLRNPGETPNQRRSKKRRPTVPMDKGTDHPLREAGILARNVYERRLAKVRELVVTGEMLIPWVLGYNTDMYYAFRHLMESIGLGHKRNPHILRHSRATHLLMAGESIYDVAKLLGDTVATVERVYGHYSPEHLFDKARRTA